MNWECQKNEGAKKASTENKKIQEQNKEGEIECEMNWTQIRRYKRQRKKRIDIQTMRIQQNEL